jgi:hypothetical protein
MDNTSRGSTPSLPTIAGAAQNAASSAGEDGARRAQDIRAEIEQTRQHISHTIDAIQEKLRPGNLVSEAAEHVKHATTERVRQMAESARTTADNVMEQTRHLAGDLAEHARHNPIPAVIIGLGVAWFLVDRYRNGGRRSKNDYDYERYAAYRKPDYYEADDSYRATSSGYDPESAEYSTMMPDSRSGQSDYGSAAAAHISEAAAQAKAAAMRTGRRARSQLGRLLSENPLLVGAVALIAGAAVGMALPETERENEWLGETRDSVLDKAQDMARTAVSRAQEAIGDVGEVAGRVFGAKP